MSPASSTARYLWSNIQLSTVWRGRWWRSVAGMGAGLAGLAGAAGAAEGWMDLEQLGNIQVITATKQLQPVWSAPSALAVITDEELRFSGVTSLPQALRLAPGADVAQINSQRYSVAIRGFPGEFSNKLLVLQNGRSLYTPQFLGVFWDAQDTVFEDVDRIEVVRGPGGTAWGINAVNGVVNVLTKDARDTQGTLVRAGGGTLEDAFGVVRHGGEWGQAAHYRVYAKAFQRGETQLANGAGVGDDWRQTRAGFRVDGVPNRARHVTVEGEVHTGRLLQYSNRVADAFESSGAHVLARWNAVFANDAGLELMTYFDSMRRRSAPATADADTFNFEANHRWQIAPRHELRTSLNYQNIRNEARGRVGHNYDPAVRVLDPLSFAVSDDFTAIKERLVLSAGFKAEHNDFTGLEVMPSARVTWTPSERKTGWLAVSRGLQVTSISDHDLTIDVPGAFRVQSVPNRGRPAVELVAVEAGWRVDPSRELSLDATVFANTYDNLDSTRSTVNATGTLLTIRPMNERKAEAHGGEVAAVWQPTLRWRVRASYSLLRIHAHAKSAIADPGADARDEGGSPRRQWQVMAAGKLGEAWSLTAWGRYVDARPALAVPAYFGLDLRLACRPTKTTEIALVGKDLLDPRHPEYSRSIGFPAMSEIPRSVLLEFTVRR